ncbi:hybrid sensor histidine kinase/response regulator [Planktothricoides raciborskii]|uniref:histidine kinase n=1 Tax=Planktothricoides raciborskii FACHB-1370 TaxID=2949576 RepID=A0ABR8EIE4_9CYAN|nr:response regulator [Planktothricoides raciborskii]MBD2545879.1 response regulator [Planktothricoides raciborskii FACHB-1370]MBD2584137.1 response regulator [Planktothricoides raciborskii FACHB-1261]
MIPKILFVDDEPALSRLIKTKYRSKVKAKELEFFFAENGLAALNTLKEQTIHIVITDINMPEMNGLVLLDKIQCLDLPVQTIVLSAYGDMQNIRSAMNRGAFDFLNKPIDFEDLEITIQRALDHLKKIQENQQKLQQAQTQLIQSEKMSTLGELVAGVAHEINNPVGFLTGNITIAEDYFTEIVELLNLYEEKFPDPGAEIIHKMQEIDLDAMKEDIPELISSMREGTDRILSLSTSLRTFSRSDISAKSSFNIHDGIDSTLRILKHRLKANEFRPDIHIIKDYGDLPTVECYPGQLNQVFMNIFANGIDALDQSSMGQSYEEILENPKTITIRTEVKPENGTVIIGIRDNGSGIPENVKEHIFEYLFTTKPVGKGTGLGLSISYQIIVEKHSGQISCVSELGEGTEFIIEIPIQ